MFALWYLSLALDELRKYLGWTSIFDIFEKSKTASSKAVDSKPATLTQLEKRENSELPKKPEPKVPELQPQLPSKSADRPNVEPVVPTRPAAAQPKSVIPNVPEKQVGPPKFESKSEPPKVEPKTEPPKVEPKSEPPKVEPKSEPPKVEAKTEPPKFEPKSKPPKVEPPKAEVPKVEPPKVESPKVASPKIQPPQPSKPKDSPTNSAFTANSPTITNNEDLLPGGNIDQKLFSSTPKSFENGNHFTDQISKPSKNVKDATSSFLEGEGGANQPKSEKR